MGDTVVSMLVQEVVGRLTSQAIKELALIWGLKEDVSILKDDFEQIKAVLQDAEEKRVKNNAIEHWLQTLRSVSLKVENVLDEISTQALLQRLHKEIGIKYMMATNNNENNDIPSAHSLSLRTILQKERLNHNNFIDWFRNLRIVLKQEKRSYILDDPIPDQPNEEDEEAYNNWVKYTEDSIQVSCLMLASMTPDLQKEYEHHGAYDMITQLKETFQQQARVERFETVRALHACRMDDTQSVSSYVLKMKSHIDRLERLNCPVSKELATDLILNSLSKRFDNFVMNYNMNGWDKNISELHSMLKTVEAAMGKKVLPVLTINEGGNKKRPHPAPKAIVAEGKGYVRGKGKGVVKAPPPKPAKKKQKVASNDPCFKCGEIGHWARNCPVYLKELQAKRDAGQTSGVQKK